LVENHFGSGAFDEIRKNHYLKDVANQDINDAFAVLWTADRIYHKKAVSIPKEIEIDSVGLRMGIWYSGRGLFNAIQHRSCVRLV
jgi:predicted RNase H-like nuclease